MPHFLPNCLGNRQQKHLT